jgi:hypothetical protein
MTRRKDIDVVKTRGVNLFWDKSVGCLVTGQTATGRSSITELSFHGIHTLRKKRKV